MAGGKSRDEVRQGLTMPGRALRKLAEVGIFAKPAVSLEHQHLAHRYVVRGTESGGAVEGIGHYLTFCGESGERLAWLHPLDAVGVNGVHAVVIAPSFVRVEMFRRGHTYDLLITRHAPGVGENGKRPPLESKVLFRALEGYLALHLAKEHKDRRGSVIPMFYSQAGEAIAVPVQFQAVLRAVVSGANCIGCLHSHYLRPPLEEKREELHRHEKSVAWHGVVARDPRGHTDGCYALAGSVLAEGALSAALSGVRPAG